MTSDTISASASASSDVPRTRFGDFLLLAIFLVANAWFTLGNYFTVPEANDWDAYGQLPWMHRWSDPSLFPDDFMTDYFQRNHLPPGVRAAYYVANQWLGIDINTASHVIMVLWYAASIATLRGGDSARDAQTAVDRDARGRRGGADPVPYLATGHVQPLLQIRWRIGAPAGPRLCSAQSLGSHGPTD